MDSQTLMLIDLENLCGTPRPSGYLATRIADELISLNVLPSSGAPVLATGVSNARVGKRVARKLGARFLAGYGRDGADMALLHAAARWLRCLEESIVQVVPRLIVCSGDHIFASLAESVCGVGGETIVCSTRASLSWQLRRACTAAVILPPLVSAR